MPLPTLSIILPAHNEADSLQTLLPLLKAAYPHAEIIVVNDGSSDHTLTTAETAGVRVISHPHSIGNGAAIKTGVRHASGDTLLLIDADSQHRVEDIATLLDEYAKGYSMVVGARTRDGQANAPRWLGNTSYNMLASWIVGRPIRDLTSGFRVVNAKKFKEFLHLLPNGFSYPSTITMAFFRSGYAVSYVNVTVNKRIGRSHIRPISDGFRFLIIIYKVATLYSPLKVFLPLAGLHFIIGLCYYGFAGHLTYFSTILISASIIIFLIGLVSEQITTLMYQQKQHENTD
ncbi:MAG: glycosyltransferase family 2 protein [Gammaproteobacteria bacterium]